MGIDKADIIKPLFFYFYLFQFWYQPYLSMSTYYGVDTKSYNMIEYNIFDLEYLFHNGGELEPYY